MFKWFWTIFSLGAPGLSILLSRHSFIYSLPRRHSWGLVTLPAPRTSADLSGKKRRPITADFHIWEVHFGPWEISRSTLLLQERSERSRERWRPYSFRTNYSVNSKEILLVATLTISLTKITSEVKFAERKSALLLNNNVWKSLLFRLSCLVPRPHFPRSQNVSGHVVHAKMWENVSARSPRIRHRNELTERDWKNAVQGLGNSLSR